MSITVRRATPRDAAAYAKLMSDPQVYGNLLQLPLPSEELWHARLSESSAAGKPDLLLCAEVEGEVVGTSGLHPAGVPLRRRHAWKLGVSVAPAAQHRGVGAAMCDYADRRAGALRDGRHADVQAMARLHPNPPRVGG